MAAVDCSKTPRSKSIKARALTLRDYEARKLAQDGRVLIVREINAPQFGPNSGKAIREVVPSLLMEPGLWDVRYELDNPRAVRCPLGPVGSPLWGREAWSPGHAAFYPHYPCVYKADGYPASHEIENGRIYGDEHREWFRFRWQSSTSMPRHASRFPRLRHESCEVKRADSLTWDELASMGLPDGPDRIVKPGSSPIEYIEIRPADMVAQLHGIPADRWAWCSLVVDLDRLEVADA